jgi:putative DNA primase/helicase
VKWDGRSQKLVPCDPPPGVVAALLGAPGPRPFPEVAGVSVTPGLRPDGTVSAAEGYDRELNVHRAADPGLRMPDGWDTAPLTHESAIAAMRLLEKELAGFPFVGPEDLSIALGMLLTALARGAVPVCPAFGISATSPGTGKSFLVDWVSVIATGQRAPAAGAGARDDETEKRLGGLIFAGYPIVSLDNVNGVLRSDTLSQAVERQRVRIRLLGSSDMRDVECRSVFIVNGNGLQLSGDMLRRHLECRMDAGVERPETRRFAFDPVERAEEDRGRYVAAALAALRAHAEAGCPGADGLVPLGSYGDWSRHVRGTLVWCGYADPAATMDRTRAEDPDAGTLRAMLDGWLARFGTSATSARAAADSVLQGGGTSLSGPAAGAAPGAFAAGSEGGADGREAGGGNVANLADYRAELLDAMLRVAGDSRGTVSAVRLGQWLRRNAGRVSRRLRFVKDTAAVRDNTVRWKVERVPGAVLAAAAGTAD